MFDSHMHFKTRFGHIGSTNTSSWFVDTFDKLQTSIQHNYPYDFMNMKENIPFFCGMSEQLLVRLTKLMEQIKGNVFTYTTKHKETQALPTENCLRQVQENRQ